MGYDTELLQRVYDAKSDAELSAAYGAWAESYDRDTLHEGYVLPYFVPAFLARYLPAGEGPILDAGVGTGLTGPFLKALGYKGLAGLDMSKDMLAVAKLRGCYDDLRQAALGSPLPWADDHFAAFICAGVFTVGHAPASGLDELVRITRPGGYAVFNIRDDVFVDNGFAAKIEELKEAGRVKSVEISPPFTSYVIGKPDHLGTVHVLEIL